MHRRTERVPRRLFGRPETEAVQIRFGYADSENGAVQSLGCCGLCGRVCAQKLPIRQLLREECHSFNRGWTSTFQFCGSACELVGPAWAFGSREGMLS